MSQLENTINENFENRSAISQDSASTELKEAIKEVIAGLDCGELRVA